MTKKSDVKRLLKVKGKLFLTFLVKIMRGSRGGKIIEEVEEVSSHYNTPLYCKVRSPPYCCALYLDPRLNFILTFL